MAFKIFELGLKKYGDIPEYILAYIDYLSHLNGSSRVTNRPVKHWGFFFVSPRSRGTLKCLSLPTFTVTNRGQQHEGPV